MADFIREEARNQEQIQKQKAMEMVEKMREEMMQKPPSEKEQVSTTQVHASLWKKCEMMYFSCN